MRNRSPNGIWRTSLLGEPELVGWRRRWIELREVPTATADAMVVAHHYSHKTTKNRFLSMGVFAPSIAPGEMLGVVQLGYGIKPKQKYTWGKDVAGDNSREFDRMWLDDRLPKFSETVVLSCLEHFLRAKYPFIKYLISYADGSTGRTGTIYKAGNYRPAGDIKADFYILPSGERIHPVTMWHRHKTRAWETVKALYPGIRRAKGRQYRFIRKLHA